MNFIKLWNEEWKESVLLILLKISISYTLKLSAYSDVHQEGCRDTRRSIVS